MDKKSSFDELFEVFDNKVKCIIVLGETKNIIKQTALKHHFLESEIYLVNDMKEAVKKAKAISKYGDTVLLSPACASWDMYENFEERGRDFIECIKKVQ